MKVYRCFTEKRPGYDVTARHMLAQLREEEGIALTGLRMLCRYDVQGIDDLAWAKAKAGVFSEPACDMVTDGEIALPAGWQWLCVETLPGQFDQRADSGAQCIAMMTQQERPLVRTATLWLFEGALSDGDMAKIRKTLINPVECREAAMDKPDNLAQSYPQPDDVPVLEGFIAPDADLPAILSRYQLAMDLDDLGFLQQYFRGEGRNPTVTELKMVDTYWSDHCRHTTFSTHLTGQDIAYAPAQATFAEYQAVRQELYGERASHRPITLMDLATCGAKILKKRGILQGLDESEEINACSVRITANVDGREEPWLLMFKNETHNHPTEIEPFGGAATCLGGAIRDPLSGRAYVYQAMRVTGAADPRTPLDQTLDSKLPQRTICRKAAAGYSAYGNQIGLATGLVSEVYHPGYVAKRLETGAVVGAVPMDWVRRETPSPGDIVLLLGGRTGRDGIGGATGSSKSHSAESLESCGAEVQKGNAPEERKLQRFFRNPAVTRLIKRCNDFGAGGVSVAIGELADGLDIDLDKIPKKYEGLTGTELAISESQERMAVVVEAKDVHIFAQLAAAENLETTAVAAVTQQPRLVMRWRGNTICDISRAFLDSNGAPKTAEVAVPNLPPPDTRLHPELADPRERSLAILSSLNVALQKGLGTRFDGTVGAASVLMPFGGKHQLTPTQVMAATLPVLEGETTTTSVMSWGFDPAAMSANPYVGAQYSCLSSVAKLAAAGCDTTKTYFSFQEFFEKPNRNPLRLGKPFSALLGALDAQLGLGVGAIGGKDSMSGTFGEIDVPPTLISFAITTLEAEHILSPEFKSTGGEVYYLPASADENGLPCWGEIRTLYADFYRACQTGLVESAWAISQGGVIEGLAKMAIGNDIGVELDKGTCDCLFTQNYGGLLAQLKPGATLDFGRKIGMTCKPPYLYLDGCTLDLAEVKAALTATLEGTYPTQVEADANHSPIICCTQRNDKAPAVSVSKPLAIIPAFPGTNSEVDTLRAVRRAGGEGRILLIRNLTADMLRESVQQLADALTQAQMLIIPGGFSGGDEPDGSGKFIQALFRNPLLTERVHELLYTRDGLVLGICNGFQALIKLGLVPYGWIQALDESSPTVTFNEIGRHQSIYANVRVSSVKSPWLSKCNMGEVYATAFSHGEGRFMASQAMLEELEKKGQLALQYCDYEGNVSNHIDCNINGSRWAVECITSPDGRVLGKMGHVERAGAHVAKNIAGNKVMPLLEGGVHYFQ